jgi:signal transduction histidine kinase
MTEGLSARHRALLVEDNPGDARLIEEMLRESSDGEFALVPAADLASALSRLGTDELDLVLLDLSLPDSQGTDTVAAVRRSSRDLPIVVLTGLEDEETAYDALQKGAQEYLVKGRFDAALLARTLQYAIRRKTLEAELEHSISLLQATLESTADGILALDRAGKVTHCNRRFVDLWEVPERILAARDAELLLTFMLDQLRDPERLRRVFDLSSREDQGYDLLEFRDGRVYERLAIPHVLEDRVIGWVWSFRDVTERRRAIEDLRQARQSAEAANRAKSGFLADLSHEIRTPLNTIVGTADLLAEVIVDPEQREYAQVLRRATQALLALVSDVLDVSKVESGRLDLESVRFALPQIVGGVIELLRPSAAQKGLALTLNLGANLPQEVVGDPNRVRQILLNLTANAIKFTERGGVTVTLEPDEERGFVHFVVEDTGIGIAREQLESIFERFTRVIAAQSSPSVGTGLGLSIARRLAHLMQGRVWAESELGIGSRFHVVLRLPSAPQPSADPPPEIALAPSVAGSTAGPDRRLRILVADDSEDNRTLIGFYLKRLPYDVDLVEDGAAAVDRFKSGRFDLVIMDLQMPVLDGYGAVKAIRRWEAEAGRPRTPILALTAYAVDEKLAESLTTGCSGFLTKPVTKDKLLSAIREHAAAPSD